MATKQRIEIEAIFSSNIANMVASTKKIQSELDRLKLPNTLDKGFSATLAKLDSEIKKFTSKTQSGIGSNAEFTALEKSGQNIINLYNQLQLEVRELANLSDKDIHRLFPESVSNNVKEATAAFTKFDSEVKTNTSTTNQLNKSLEKQKTTLDQIKKRQDALDKIPKTDILPEGEFNARKSAKTKAQTRFNKALAAKEGIEKDISELPANRLNKNGMPDARFSENQAILEQLRSATQEYNQAKAALDEATSKLSGKHNATDIANQFDKLEREANEAETKINEITQTLLKLGTANDGSFSKLKSELSTITGLDFSNFKNTPEDIQRMKDMIAQLDASRIEQIRQNFEPLDQEIREAANATDQLEAGMTQAAQATESMVRKQQEIDNLKNTLTQFVSITNVFYLFRRAINEAFQSIAELDKAMTETAVVTDFSVGDMWEQLPQYTERANELGVSVLGAYETMTLFYQQGLKTNEVMEIGTETMKMARIGGMDYADATNKMTAALRGFNMELNTLSAQRVSDVYSELAAITAADTDEISTAMTKTASIANSANMEFETTAAFLSQIIETTRESAETAGTALKTVIARFQELKKDPSEIGEVDGEVVDANKIETALRSVGVALRDPSGQFRDLDDVFLELSEKWDTLDTNTQRYVATIAAGSRQQSRFIAMMSNYSRTVELVGAAYNSAGSAQKQYEKTLESWESKIAKFRNAWQEFILGIINSDLAKHVVDLGTWLLNFLNKMTQGFGGLSTSILRVVAVLGGLKLAKAIGPAVFDSILSKGKPLGAGLGQGIREGLQTEFGRKKGFKIPIGISSNILKQNEKITELSNLATVAEGAGDSDVLSAAIKEKNKLEEKRAAYLNASAAAQLRYNAAVAQGIPVGEAENLLTEESTVEDYKKMAASHGVEEAEIEGTVATQGSILARIQQTLATKIETAVEARNTAGKKVGTIANWAYAHSAIAAKLAMLGIAAAAVAVVAGIVEIIKHIKNNTPEKKLERAAEATKKAQKAADAAKDAYNELNNTLKSLDEYENELDTLIEGTDAWRKKVIEINREFSKLIDLYPDLQKFIKFDAEKGVYQWTDGGQAAKKYLESANIEMAERQYEVSNNREIERDAQITKEVTDYNQFGANHYTPVSLSDEEAKQIAFELNKFGGRASEDELRKILENALPTATQEMINALAKNSEGLYTLTDSINNQIIDTRPQTEAYVSTLLNTNDAYADIEDPNLKKYILATTVNKTEEEGFTEGKYKKDSDVINAYKTENRADLDATYGKGKYTIELKDGQITVQDLDGNVIRTAGTVEQVRKQLSIEDYIEKDLNVAVTTQQFNDEVDKVLTTIYGINAEKATPEQLNNVLQIVLTAAEKNIGFSAEGDNNNYYATGFSGLSYQDLEALTNKPEFKELVEKAIAAKQNSVTQTNESFNFDIETDADWSKAGQDLDMSTEALELYTQEIEKNSAALQGNKNAAKLVAAEGLTLKKAFSELEPIFEDSASALNNFGSPEYFKAIDKIAKALKNIAGLENITPEDITPDRLQLLKDAMNGSTDAFIRFRKELALDKALKLDLPTEDLNYITNALNDLNGFDAEISASFDTSQLEAKMLELYNAGKITAAGLNEIFSGVGYKFVVDYVDKFPITPTGIDDAGDRWFMEKHSAMLAVPQLKMVPIGETGISNFSSSTDTSGGSSDSGNDYEADYDKHYNKMEDLAEEQRVRNRLEEDYNKLLKDNNSTISEMVENLDKQIASLEREREIQEFLYDARKQQIRDTMSEYSDLQGYASYNFADNTIEIDYDAIKAITDEELGSRIDEYIGKLEEFQDQMDEAQDALAEIDEAVQDIRDRGKDQFFDFEQKVLDAVVKSLEEEIESMNQVNDSINEANDELMNAINSTLERQRQEEENTQTEQDLSDMQRRLDYLRQDTSGANLLEIKQLEKELSEAQDDYTDALIDQKISEIEQQNEEAAQQRERQIAFAEAQLQAAQETGALWKDVHALMTAGIGPGGIKVDSELWNLMTQADEYAGKSFLDQLSWGNELNEQVKQGLGWLRVGQDTESLLADNTLSEGQEITFKVGDKTLTGKLNADGTVSAEGNTYSGVFRNYDGSFMTDEEYKAPVVTPPEPNVPGGGDEFNLNIGSKVRVKKGHEWHYDSYGNGPTGWDSSTDRVVQISYAAPGNPYPYHVSDLDGGWLGWLKKEDLMAFKTGGLADFTGPAWLDGTKSRPELILNQRDTQNFLQLRDILAEATKAGFGDSENNEAVVFDIDINIDKVENEENVDALLNELERRINSYASYRNVTALTLKR